MVLTGMFLVLGIILSGLLLLISVIFLIVNWSKLKSRNIWLSLTIISFISLTGLIGYTIYSVITSAKTGWSKMIDSVDSYNNTYKDTRLYLLDEDSPNEQIELLKSYHSDSLNKEIPNEFYTDFGYSDDYRFPLRYPYSIHYSYDLDNGYLKKIEKSTQKYLELTAIKRFDFDQNYFLAESQSYVEGESKMDYLLYHFDIDEIERFATLRELSNRASELNYSKNLELKDGDEYEMLFY